MRNIVTGGRTCNHPGYPHLRETSRGSIILMFSKYRGVCVHKEGMLGLNVGTAIEENAYSITTTVFTGALTLEN